MDKAALLAHLRALLERQPDWSDHNAVGRDHQQWLAQARAMLKRWDPIMAVAKIDVKAPYIGQQLWHQGAVEEILQTVENAIADLELEVPLDAEVVFGPGAVYDFFRRLNQITRSAETSIFVVDPYMNETIFDYYLQGREPAVTVRLLCKEYGGAVAAAAQKYTAQHGAVVEVRQCNDAHDRVLFIDGTACFVIGQSLKDAATAKPTYIAPLAPDVSLGKLGEYESMWQTANPI